MSHWKKGYGWVFSNLSYPFELSAPWKISLSVTILFSFWPVTCGIQVPQPQRYDTAQSRQSGAIVPHFPNNAKRVTVWLFKIITENHPSNLWRPSKYTTKFLLQCDTWNHGIMESACSTRAVKWSYLLNRPDHRYSPFRLPFARRLSKRLPVFVAPLWWPVSLQSPQHLPIMRLYTSVVNVVLAEC